MGSICEVDERPRTSNAGGMVSIRRGATRNPDPIEAAEHLAVQLGGRDAGAVVFFASARYDLERLEAVLEDRFEGAQLLGCTTAGELSTDGYAENSLVGMSFSKSDFVVVSDHCDGIAAASLLQLCELVQSLMRRMQIRAPGSKPQNTFAMLLIDGLAGSEEPVLSAISRELGEIPLVGGSAGDDLRFRETVVFHDGAFRTGAAVLALVHTLVPFEVFKTQHIRSTDTKMVITEADPVRRVVSEINAEPAAREYARLSGIEREGLAPMELATHPLSVRVGGDDYVRSIRSVNDDESMTFYCAIDEGIVLSAARASDMLADLRALFARIESSVGKPTAVLGFDCIFRKLELQQSGLQASASRILSANNVIGFSTYGEQFHAMHLNQTFSGVAFGSRLP